jgi:hypothetical protein
MMEDDDEEAVMMAALYDAYEIPYTFVFTLDEDGVPVGVEIWAC